MEQYLGRTLGSTHINTILYIYDELHFSSELIEYLVEYCVSRGSKSIRYIETGCGIMYTGSKRNLPRQDGTASEILFDIVTIDPVKRTIHLARAGAGEDREFTY